MGTFARLWGEIELAEGSTASAKSWLTKAKKIYDEGGDTTGSVGITRLLVSLKS
jgi:hypothetical protein